MCTKRNRIHRGHDAKNPDACTGLTLVELVVAVGAALLVASALFYTFLGQSRSYTLQEQITEMNKNARFTISRLSALLSQAGADLPLNYPIVTANASDDITVLMNPGGGIQVFWDTLPSSLDAPVFKASRFFGAANLVRHRAGGIVDTLELNDTHSSGDYTQGVDTVSNRIRLKAPASFLPGDTIFSIAMQRYFLNGSRLCLNDASTALAENIDSLEILFYESDGTTQTTQWSRAVTAHIRVTAMTEKPDPVYMRHADNRRRVSLSTVIRMNNAPGGTP